MSVIIEKFLEYEEHFIIQKFINGVSKGDKRILLINGEPVGAINRIPNKKSRLEQTFILEEEQLKQNLLKRFDNM